MHDRTNMVVFLVTICLVVIMCIAVVQQEFSWWVIPFVVLFGTLFAGVFAICYSIYRTDRYRRNALKEHPDHPWMWNAAWRTPVIPSQGKSGFWGTLALTVIVSMFAVSGVGAMINGMPEGNLWTLLGLIPVAAAAYGVLYTCKAWKSWRLGGRVSLLMDTRPAWIGSALSARLTLPADIQPGQLSATLEYLKVNRVEESDGVSFERVTDRSIPGLVETGFNDGGHSSVAIIADIPPGCPETSWTEEEPNGRWDIVVTLRRDGTELPLRYTVPVADPAKY